jgi:serine protease
MGPFSFDRVCDIADNRLLSSPCPAVQGWGAATITFPDLVQEHGVSTSVDSLVGERLAKATWWGCVAALALTAGGAVRAQAPQTEPEAPQALGVIVKLKDGRLTTADGRGMARPSSFSPEVAQRRRLMTSRLAQRHRVSYLVQKDTVFGAQVLHRGVPTDLRDAEAEAQRLRQDPEVEWAVPNEIMKPAAVTGQSVPSVNYSGRFWIRPRSEAGDGVANFPAAWTFLAGRTLNPVVTAVLDSGVTFSKSNVDSTVHPDFDNRLFSGYDFVADVATSNDGNGRDSDASDPGDWVSSCPDDPADCQDSSWHGTTITSMLSAPRTSSGSGIEMGPGIFAPIAGQPVVLPIRVGGTGGASSIDIIEAMYWAAGVSSVNGTPNNHPARVISISYGSVGNCQGGSNTVDALYRNAIATLRSLGVVVVASAGNGNGLGVAGFASPSKPASCQGVIASTGLRADASKASYANLVNGTRANQCYYGVAVASGDSGQGLAMLGNTGTTVPGTTQVVGGIEGTSFAAPQVAGVAALMLAVNPALSSVDVAYRIMQSATAFPGSGPAVCSASNLDNCRCTSGTCGAGVLDAEAAVIAAQNPPVYSEGVCPSPDVESASSRGGGGGGASDAQLLALLAGLVSWMMGAAAWSRWRARG